MAGPLCLLDTNILLRWLKPDERDYPLVVKSIERLIQGRTGLCYASQNVAEFWNSCTRPLGRNGYGLTPQETDRRAKLFEEKLLLLTDSLAVHREWRSLIVTHNVRGVQVHDARLVAIMRVHGIEQILTFNDADFARYSDIEAVHPSRLAGAKNR
jgi:predicted nucleic acid-binding protein